MRVPFWTNQDLVLYHGTTESAGLNILHNGVDLRFGRPKTDFGHGFYTSTKRDQALRFAGKLAGRRAEPATVIEFRVERDALAAFDLLGFVRGDVDALDYWSLVTTCRSGAPGHGRSGNGYYDVVCGPVARNYEIKTLHPNYDQMSFHTPDAIELLNRPGRRRMM